MINVFQKVFSFKLHSCFANKTGTDLRPVPVLIDKTGLDKTGLDKTGLDETG